ncbi:S1-C subfamily serine protease [Tamaricihabitans halophyticus]|uniref:S1-C subfamily serine protease n=1 Tax=Tamaricihabitans halophyticus TaxID=1262583 RepID=A0A4R2R2H9_9PSEU|nr:trypsin-like peptidase domain-containing protein [Tamaricihabitans halophyticus]TCP56217.1 S1-C subfamily serine protease [Tamaricihabitans halophyticus]
MTESNANNPGGAEPTPGESDQPWRVQPRPLDRPSVDPNQASVFGRPRGIDGSFDPVRAGNGRLNTEPRLAPPPPEALAAAFGRTSADQETSLQRPPGADSDAAELEDPLWSGPNGTANPWRDPGSGARLGAPAVSGESEAESDAPLPKGAQLSLREVLFGQRVRTRALVLLGVIALAVGAVGGGIGWWFATMGNDLNRSVTLADVEPGKERAKGSVADIAARVAPAVVSIEVKSGDGGGVGSGVVIDGDGYVITNHHVVASAVDSENAKVFAVFRDGTRAEAQLVGNDPKTDLAVIKVNVTNPTVIQSGSSAELQPGDGVVAVGSPFGLADTVTEGIVSAVQRPVTAPGENGEPPVVYDAIQTDASINPGNSGGALVDSSGALVGINSLIRTVGGESGQGGSIGLGFAIPIDQANKIAEELIANGEVKHADLGVNARSVSASSSEGAQVQSVRGDGPASKAGIEEGDVITRVAERQVRNAAELTVAVRENEIGDDVEIALVRGGRELTVEATLGSD